MLEEMMIDAVFNIGKTKEDLTKEDKIKIVQYLNNKGFFLIKKNRQQTSGIFRTYPLYHI